MDQLWMQSWPKIGTVEPNTTKGGGGATMMMVVVVMVIE